MLHGVCYEAAYWWHYGPRGSLCVSCSADGGAHVNGQVSSGRVN